MAGITVTKLEVPIGTMIVINELHGAGTIWLVINKVRHHSECVELWDAKTNHRLIIDLDMFVKYWNESLGCIVELHKLKQV